MLDSLAAVVAVAVEASAVSGLSAFAVEMSRGTTAESGRGGAASALKSGDLPGTEPSMPSSPAAAPFTPPSTPPPLLLLLLLLLPDAACHRRRRTELKADDVDPDRTN